MQSIALQFIRLALVSTAVLLLSSCGSSPEPTTSTPDPEAKEMAAKTLTEVLNAHAPRLIQIEGVQAVYESITDDGRSCVKIDVDVLTEALKAQLPDELEGWPVVVEASGEIRPLGRNDQ